jgi:hypothetical protein
MTMEEFLKEMAEKIPYEQRKVKGQAARQEAAAKFLEAKVYNDFDEVIWNEIDLESKDVKRNNDDTKR